MRTWNRTKQFGTIQYACVLKCFLTVVAALWVYSPGCRQPARSVAFALALEQDEFATHVCSQAFLLVRQATCPMEILPVGLAARVGDKDIELTVATGPLNVIGKLHGTLARGKVTTRSLCRDVPVTTRLVQDGVGALHRLRHGRCGNSTEEMCRSRSIYQRYKV